MAYGSIRISVGGELAGHVHGERDGVLVDEAVLALLQAVSAGGLLSEAKMVL